MDIPDYLRCLAEGKDDEASDIIREIVPLALTLGYICHHPCETECRRSELNQAVAICDLKRFALEKATSQTHPEKKETTGKRVAIVGSGPAGLVAAHFLAQLGHAVKVFESRAEAGGMLRWAIPEYRLPRDVVRKEIKDIEAMGVEIQVNTPIDKETFLQELHQEKWDAVFLATGAQESKKIQVEGLPGEGVFWGLDFLRKAKEGRQRGLKGKVVVIGGGNVALDVALTSLRLGASSVDLVCLEKREEMPAFDWEIREAEEEGIVLHPGWGPLKIERNGGETKGIFLGACTSIFDEKGYFCPQIDSSLQKKLEAHSIVLAVGQSTDLAYLPKEVGIKIKEEGLIHVHPQTLEATVSGLFAGGEATLGPSSAVEAMTQGRKAASSIDRFLGGEGLKDVQADQQIKRNRLWTAEEDFALKERAVMSSLPIQERICSFDLIQLGYSEEEARQEANRCLRCNLRLHLTSVTLPPEKWLEFTHEVLSHVPDTEGAFQLLDEEKNCLYIAGTPHLRKELQEQLSSRPEAKYFSYVEDPMYTKKESELIQQFLQKHGHLPPGNEEVEDLF
jgi:NADPH-dependent glutamate synthase beta subunit-like oxidoreductase